MKKQPKKAGPKGATREPDATLIYYKDGGSNLVMGAVVPFSRNKQCAIPYTLVPLYAADPTKEAVYRAAMKWAKHCNEGHVIYHHDSLEQLRRAIERAERKKK